MTPETVYGMFVTRRDTGVPSVAKLLNDRIYSSLDDALARAENCSAQYECRVEVRSIHIQVGDVITPSANPGDR